MRRYGVAVMAVLAIMGFISGCTKPTAVPRLYGVIFSSEPDIYDPGVYADGVRIGEIVSKDGHMGGPMKYRLSVQDAFEPLMTTSTVFYVSAGRLNRATLDAFGESLPIETPVLGFKSKMSMGLFKIGTALRPSSAAALGKAAQLAGRMPPGTMN